MGLEGMDFGRGLAKNTSWSIFWHFISDSYACGVPDPDNGEIIITGGWDSSTQSLFTARLAGRGTCRLWLWADVSMPVLVLKMELRNQFLSPEAGTELSFSTAQKSLVTMSGGPWLGLCLSLCIARELHPKTTGCFYLVKKQLLIKCQCNVIIQVELLDLIHLIPSAITS